MKPSKNCLPHTLQISRFIFALALLWPTGCGSSKSKTSANEGACESSKASVIGDPCFARNEALNVTNISEKNGTKSHNMGQNCFSCHQPRGNGKGIYTLAGTVFKQDGSPYPNTRITLYSDGAKTQTVASVDSDALGNFYTTNALPFPNQALFVKIQSADGEKSKAMPFPTLSGSCNVCHTGGSKLVLPD